MPQEYPFWVSGKWKTTSERLEVTYPYDGRLVGITYQAGPGRPRRRSRGRFALLRKPAGSPPIGAPRSLRRSRTAFGNGERNLRG